MAAPAVEVCWPEIDIILSVEQVLLLSKPRGLSKSEHGTVAKAQVDLTVDEAEILSARLSEAVRQIRQMESELPKHED